MESTIEKEDSGIFLYDPKGNLEFLSRESKEEKLKKKKYKIIVFYTSKLRDFYKFFEDKIRHKDIMERLLLILVNDFGNVDELNNPPLYFDFFKGIEKIRFIEFDLKDFLAIYFKIYISSDDLLSYQLNWFFEKRLQIIYYRSKVLDQDNSMRIDINDSNIDDFLRICKTDIAELLKNENIKENK